MKHTRKDALMRRSAALLAAALISALAAPATAADGRTPAAGRSAVEKTFLIPASEGYGVGECLTSPGSECGQVVANAWCEAQGFASAQSFGVAAQDEYTGAITPPPVSAPPSEKPLKITCQD